MKLWLISHRRHREDSIMLVAVRKLYCELYIYFPLTFLIQMARYNFLTVTLAGLSLRAALSLYVCRPS